MRGKMRAVLMPEIRKMEMIQLDIPQIESDEVLIKVKHVGICGSDVHYYEYGRIGDFVVENPIILGHEFAGEIVEVGSLVKHLKSGDEVTVEPGKPCGKCKYCMSGDYNLCPDMIFMATPPINGCLSEYLAYPAHLCYKLPDNMSTAEGALVDPVAVGYHAAFQGYAKVGKSAIVLGAGCIGLMSMMALKTAGVSPVCITDVLDNRLVKAMELGADGVYKAEDDKYIEKAKADLNNEGFDIVIETAGSPYTIRQSTKLVNRGGVIVLVGMSPNSENVVDTAELMAKEAAITTVFRYKNIWPIAISAIASGEFPVHKIVSATYPFEKTKEAFERCVHDKENVIKVVIEF